MDAFIGCILPVAFNYAPRGWVFCNGQTLPVTQNAAMFALLGTIYGGDGRTTFGIPDLRGRVLVGSQDVGPGLTSIAQGAKVGTNNVNVIATGAVSVAIGVNNLPSHSHNVNAATIVLNIPVNDVSPLAGGSTNTGSTDTPGPTTVLSVGTAKLGTLTGTTKQYTTSAATTNLSPININIPASATSATGGGVPITAPVTTSAVISVMQPSIGMNFIICVEGIYPSRN